MAVSNADAHDVKKISIMEKCFDCYAEHGFGSVGIKGLAQACGISSGNLYFYFENLDDLVIQSTEYCMSKVEEDFMACAPDSAAELEDFIDEIPYWTAEKHGRKYRLMYQIYTHPKYAEYGKKFFEGVNCRYTQYAKMLEDKIGIPYDITTPLIFMLIRACVHYALFGDEFYLQAQLGLLKQMAHFALERFGARDAVGTGERPDLKLIGNNSDMNREEAELREESV